jgi:hypothetical protein
LRSPGQKTNNRFHLPKRQIYPPFIHQGKKRQSAGKTKQKPPPPFRERDAARRGPYSRKQRTQTTQKAPNRSRKRANGEGKATFSSVSSWSRRPRRRDEETGAGPPCAATVPSRGRYGTAPTVPRLRTDARAAAAEEARTETPPKPPGTEPKARWPHRPRPRPAPTIKSPRPVPVLPQRAWRQQEPRPARIEAAAVVAAGLRWWALALAQGRGGRALPSLGGSGASGLRGDKRINATAASADLTAPPLSPSRPHLYLYTVRFFASESEVAAACLPAINVPVRRG